MPGDGRPPAYRLHGLVVASEVPLNARKDETGPPPDLLVVVTPPKVTASSTSPVVLAYDYADGTSVTVTDETAGYLVDHSGVCRFLVSHDLSEVQVSWCGERGAALAPVLLEGWVMAFVLQMAGRCVLHASAVAFEDGPGAGGAVAFLGNSGMGKSTVATLLCGDGASFLADDVLRVEAAPTGPRAYRGSQSARLRPAASSLADGLPRARSAPTSDGRLGVTFAGDDLAESVPLRAVLVPWPSKEATAVSVSWLAPRPAVVELSTYPRLYDWRVAGPPQRQFEWAATVAPSLPVGHLTVPWGPPWTADLVDDLRATLLDGLATPAPR